MIAGLYFPIPAAAIGLAIVVARFIYAIGYTTNSGPAGRTVGALLNDILVLGLFGLAVTSSIFYLQGSSFPNWFTFILS